MGIGVPNALEEAVRDALESVKELKSVCLHASSPARKIMLDLMATTTQNCI